VYCRDLLRIEGRIDADGANYRVDCIKSCSRDVENGSDPVEAEVLFHDEGANERSTTDQGDGMISLHKVLLLEPFLKLEVIICEFFHLVIDADGSANDVLQFL
jgi:hypothetical protein